MPANADWPRCSHLAHKQYTGFYSQVFRLWEPSVRNPRLVTLTKDALLYWPQLLVAQRWRICLPMQETWIQSLGQEDLLEKEMATHSSILAWKIPWMEEPGELQSMGSQRVRHDWATSLSLSIPGNEVEVKSLSGVWLCDPMDHNLPDSSIHGVSPARVLEWVAISSSKDTKSQIEAALFSSRLENMGSRSEQLPTSCPYWNMNKTWILYRYDILTLLFSPGLIQ